MAQDWRLVNQHKYLQGKKLKLTTFSPSQSCDHKHCAFCWDKFGQDDDMLHRGYCTADKLHWICELCYLDFKDIFQWTIED